MLTSTDSLDGWLARRDGATRSGAFLDPVADKFDRPRRPRGARGPRRLPVVARSCVIAAREFGDLARTGRSRAGAASCCRRSGSASTRRSCSTARSGFVLLPITADWDAFQDVVLYVAVALTVVSGLAIVRHGWIDFQQQET